MSFTKSTKLHARHVSLYVSSPVLWVMFRNYGIASLEGLCWKMHDNVLHGWLSRVLDKFYRTVVFTVAYQVGAVVVDTRLECPCSTSLGLASLLSLVNIHSGCEGLWSTHFEIMKELLSIAFVQTRCLFVWCMTDTCYTTKTSHGSLIWTCRHCRCISVQRSRTYLCKSRACLQRPYSLANFILNEIYL